MQECPFSSQLTSSVARDSLASSALHSMLYFISHFQLRHVNSTFILQPPLELLLLAMEFRLPNSSFSRKKLLFGSLNPTT